MESKLFGIKPFGATPSSRQLNHLKMGKKAFFHFGVNTFSDKEWGDGTETEKLFNPEDIDVRGWIRDIKEAGFELAILTAKHHDGFCLWPSKFTEHSIRNSPYKGGKGDIVKEFTDACREFNVRAGLYLSPWDRNSPFWGSDEYSDYYAKQLEEILTGYGRIDEIWWDGAGSQDTRYDWEKWAGLIRKHQPEAVIFGSMGATPYVEMRWVGNEAGLTGTTHYASIDESSLTVENNYELNTGKLGGERYIPAEVDVSIKPGWFYHKDQDGMGKSARRLDEIWFNSVGNNAIMLLNFPPDREGKLDPRDVENATESDRRMKKMLSVNMLRGAQIEADSVYCPECGIGNATLTGDGQFYASAPDKSRAVIDITLPEDVPPVNVLTLGEKVELGERITSFTLEALDGAEPKKLCTGTSVGYFRAMRFEKGKYKRLRLTVTGAMAPLTLRTLAIGIYDEDTSEEAKQMTEGNLAALSSAETVISEDGKTAVINFGGIYSFDTVCFFGGHSGGSYRISAFDGSKFYTVAEGAAKEHYVCAKTCSPITSSYQVKIEYDRMFWVEPDFKVFQSQ